MAGGQQPSGLEGAKTSSLLATSSEANGREAISKGLSLRQSDSGAFHNGRLALLQPEVEIGDGLIQVDLAVLLLARDLSCSSKSFRLGPAAVRGDPDFQQFQAGLETAAR